MCQALKQKFCNIFHMIMEDYKMVNEVYKELWYVIERSLLRIHGKILSDVYLSVTARTMKKSNCGDKQEDDEEEEGRYRKS